MKREKLRERERRRGTNAMKISISLLLLLPPPLPLFPCFLRERNQDRARFLVVSSKRRNDLNYNLGRDVSLPDRYKISNEEKK